MSFFKSLFGLFSPSDTKENEGRVIESPGASPEPSPSNEVKEDKQDIDDDTKPTLKTASSVDRFTLDRLLKVGVEGDDVYDFQTLLNSRGITAQVTGYYGSATERLVRQFQSDNDLSPDGIVGNSTLETLKSEKIDPKALTSSKVLAVAKRFNCDMAAILAVDEVEAAGSGFFTDGRCKILFERHIFYQQLEKAGKDVASLSKTYPSLINRKAGGYSGGVKEYDRLNAAMNIDADCARESASWGSYQVMGYYWDDFGYRSIDDWVDQMELSENNHLEAFARYCENTNGCIEALQNKDWAEFARLYNGPNYKKYDYDTKLETAYNKHIKYTDSLAA